jgi:hypothetical protein
MAMGKNWIMPVADRRIPSGNEFESILADVFRKAGWLVRRPSSVRDMGVDLLVDAGKRRYVVQLKASSEGRRDRLVPLLAQAILEAQGLALRFPKPAVPLAVVAANRIPASLAAHLQQFAERHAPGVGIGIIDAEGLRSFAGPGLEGLDVKPSRRAALHFASSQPIPNLFSGLNQWMLKIILGQHLPESLISVPREQIRNASQLAKVANVSVMSASRLVNQLASEGFLDERGEHLQIARADELLERWVSANRQAARDIPARYIIKKDQRQFLASIAEYAAQSSAAAALKSKARRGRVAKASPRCCIGLFAAADALGFGFVRGVLPHLYLERLDLDVLRRLGLSLEESDRRADVYLRIPSNRESIFRAAVMRGSLPVSDVLQVWLDVSAHPARGREQADEIRRRALKPLFGKQR